MPIFGGPPGLTFNFEVENETVPAGASLVIGDSKLLSTWSSNGILDLWRDSDGPGGGNWAVVVDPAGDEWDAGADISTLLALTGIEAAMWRLENAVAADRDTFLSVINVG